MTVLNAEFYGIRKIIQHRTLDVSLDTQQCRKQKIEKGSIMREIAGKGIFIIVPEQAYQNNPILREQIERIFREAKPEEVI